jgi:release factor glutamine methyltransferase
MSTVSLRALLAEATERLRPVSELPEVDARRIVERMSGHDATELRFELDRPVTTREIAFFDRMLARRAAGEPLQYVLGSWGFRHLDLFLDRRVLIPRPETEIVTEIALAELRRAAAAHAVVVEEGAPRAVDLGTGSGAIALSLAFEHPTVEVWATDASADALDIARANLAGIGRHARRVRLVQGDWFGALDDALAGTFDLVVSNPPYVAADEELPEVVRAWEPATALVPGPTGLEAYEVLVAEGRRWLRPTGVLVLEIGAAQGPALRALGAAHGWAEAEVHPDLTGRDRAVVLRP